MIASQPSELVAGPRGVAKRVEVGGLDVCWCGRGEAERWLASGAMLGRLLHPWELARLHSLHAPRRRATFVAGRIAAKAALAAATGHAAAELAVLSWDRNGRGREPAVWLRGRRLAGRLSIAHDDQQAVACWSSDASLAVGVDIGSADGRLRPSPMWFDRQERRTLTGLGLKHEVEVAAHAWFLAKEAAFKLSAAVRFRPLDFCVAPGGRRAIVVRHTSSGNGGRANYTVSLHRMRLAQECVIALSRRAYYAPLPDSGGAALRHPHV